ncbi:short-chain dehydrogenase/reductase SDR [Apiospora saccharicola]|uniref:Short-chain dehydrogenase/reductase SDR n=1 Tax=Apiospora saccharicola TaxID=335842 RepID=A0ABR1UMB0_9PEZI
MNSVPRAISTGNSPSSPKPLSQAARLDSQTAIVTGASVGGLGFEAAKELAAHGLARLILGVWTVASGETAK